MSGEIDQRTGLEVLDRDECVALMSLSSLGRIAVVVDERPLMFPVNFTLDGDAVVFRSDAGTKVYAARHRSVAFECDGIDGLYHTGWSVLVTGIAEEIVNEAELARLARLPLGPWCAGPKSTWLRIQPRTLTGRRIPQHGHTRTEGN